MFGWPAVLFGSFRPDHTPETSDHIMKLPDLRRACTVLVLAVVGCAEGTPVTTAATDRAAVSLPDFSDSAELEKALVSFGECVEQSFPIVMRFRADPFIGLSTEVGSQRKEDGERVDRVVSGCMGQLDLDRRLSVYQGEHPISPADQRELVEDFVSCVGAISPEVSNLASGANLASLDSVMTFVSELPPQNAGRTEDEPVSECHSELWGPERVFIDGHPWFNP